MRYVALIDGKSGAYGVVFPDLLGCTAMGRTIDEALTNAADALRDWAEVTEEDGNTVPPPRSAEMVCQDADVRAALASGAQLAAVPLIRATGKPVKTNLSLDAGIRDALDAEAERRGLTRTAMVEAMVREMLPRVG